MDDLISRQAAIEAVEILLEQTEEDADVKTWNNAIRGAINSIKHHVPSAQQVRTQMSSADDLISRQDVIDALDCISGVEEVLRSLPSAQQERAMKDCRNCKHGNYNDHWDTYFCYYSGDCNDWDKWEPSVQPERKKGKWINVRHGNIAECDQCGIKGRAWMNFCFECGADMMEETK